MGSQIWSQQTSAQVVRMVTHFFSFGIKQLRKTGRQIRVYCGKPIMMLPKPVDGRARPRLKTEVILILPSNSHRNALSRAPPACCRMTSLLCEGHIVSACVLSRTSSCSCNWPFDFLFICFATRCPQAPWGNRCTSSNRASGGLGRGVLLLVVAICATTNFCL